MSGHMPSRPAGFDEGDPVNATPPRSPEGRGSQSRLIAGAFIAAALLAFMAIVPAVGGIATWKIVLGLIGLVLFVMGGRGPSR
jgi:hypothetical protein